VGLVPPAAWVVEGKKEDRCGCSLQFSLRVFNIEEEHKGIKIEKESLKIPDFQRGGNVNIMS